MQHRTWKFGEPCFITDMSIGLTQATMRIMPAIITHIGGTDGRVATATAFSTDDFGKQFVEGSPHASEKEAREWLDNYVTRISDAAKQAEVSGMRPGWYIPSALPRNGETVYVIDKKTGEILEVVVGIVKFDHGFLEFGYDESPGNPETSMIRFGEWWKSPDEAQRAAKEKFGRELPIIAKAEVARRADARIEKVWDDTMQRLNDPAWIARHNEGMRKLAKQPISKPL